MVCHTFELAQPIPHLNDALDVRAPTLLDVPNHRRPERRGWRSRRRRRGRAFDGRETGGFSIMQLTREGGVMLTYFVEGYLATDVNQP